MSEWQQQYIRRFPDHGDIEITVTQDVTQYWGFAAFEWLIDKMQLEYSSGALWHTAEDAIHAAEQWYQKRYGNSQ